MEQQRSEILTQLGQKEPFHVVFYANDQIIQCCIQLPLYQDVKTTTNGTHVDGLRQWLDERLHNPFEILGIVPMTELYSPILPLLWINTLAYQAENRLELGLILRCFENPQRSVEIPFSLADLHSERRTSMGIHLVQALQHDGFIRLTMSLSETKKIQQCYATIGEWLLKNDRKRWVESIDIDTSSPCRGRFVGFSQDTHRQWLQLRQPFKTTHWPPDALTPDFAALCLDLFQFLDTTAFELLQLIAQVLGLTSALPDWMDSHYFTNDASSSSSSSDSRYGASVLRVYNYNPKDQIETTCGVHADLGLLTIAPCATEPGLVMYQGEWIKIEEETKPNELIVFPGETLGLITNGLIRASLHCVSQSKPRMSMPFFLRARPESILTRNESCKSFMDKIFSNRVWKRKNLNNAVPDY